MNQLMEPAERLQNHLNIYKHLHLLHYCARLCYVKSSTVESSSKCFWCLHEQVGSIVHYKCMKPEAKVRKQ